MLIYKEKIAKMAIFELWLPNLYNVRTIDMTPFLERRAEIVAMQEPLRIVRKALAA